MRRGHGRTPVGARPPRRDERGETLIELLVTVAIMGVGIIGVLLSITNAIVITDRISDGTRANVLAQEQAELIKDPVERAPYVDCATVSDYPPLTQEDVDPDDDIPDVQDQSIPPGWTVEITAVRYWDGDETAVEIAWLDDPTACLSQVGGDQGLQQVTIEVRSAGPERQVIKEVVVAKRDRSCPAGTPQGVTLC